MGSTSVTGKGKGAGYANKGSQSNREIYLPKHSAHVVCSGLAELSGTTLTVTFPTPLAGGHAKYVVMLTSAEASTTPAQVTTLTDSAGDFVSFVITNASGKDTFWTVMTRGF